MRDFRFLQGHLLYLFRTVEHLIPKEIIAIQNQSVIIVVVKAIQLKNVSRSMVFHLGGKKGKPQPGGVRGGNWNKANHTTTEREHPVVDAQALEKYNFMLKLFEGLSSTQGSSTDFSYHVTSQGMNQVQACTSKSWIIDTGATNHMT